MVGVPLGRVLRARHISLGAGTPHPHPNERFTNDWNTSTIRSTRPIGPTTEYCQKEETRPKEQILLVGKALERFVPNFVNRIIAHPRRNARPTLGSVLGNPTDGKRSFKSSFLSIEPRLEVAHG